MKGWGSRALSAWESMRAPVRAAAERRDQEFTPPPLPMVVEPVPEVEVSPDQEVSRGIRIAAAWSWRLLLIGAAGYFVLILVGRLSAIVIPIIVALLLSALLTPLVGWLRRARLPGSLATAIALIAGIAAIVGVLTAVIQQFVSGFPLLTKKAAEGIEQIQDYLKTGPLHMTDHQLNQMLDTVRTWLVGNKDNLTENAVSTFVTTAHVLTGMLLVLFVTFFFLRDGQRIWTFLVGLFPVRARESLGGAGQAAWRTLVAYVRATVLVAFIDGVGIGMAVWLLGVPQFALPLGALVFLGAFIPIIGATLTGAIAVLVAFVIKGPFTALLVFAAVIAVQQLEGHVLQPLIMGRAVAIHPLAVIVAIGAGLVLAGIVGALVAVPLVATLNTGIRYIVGRNVVLTEMEEDTG
ncbi:AI-2E family transporter [Longispora fulva]|uniref:Putative PurR-regulated permease PerM n=1 Tax=Longispora fulva TaxID=619741 RepID=A0A8J7GM77_9ACTN|nr:AI-2E family transporter [Longispora fulva]MBG6139418.1 putative PurR-regulated permease PerM [Longispora fulva]GIG58917.1 AI-2E family transporter [Longispora fulva]